MSDFDVFFESLFPIENGPAGPGFSRDTVYIGLVGPMGESLALEIEVEATEGSDRLWMTGRELHYVSRQSLAQSFNELVRAFPKIAFDGITIVNREESYLIIEVKNRRSPYCTKLFARFLRQELKGLLISDNMLAECRVRRHPRWSSPGRYS